MMPPFDAANDFKVRCTSQPDGFRADEFIGEYIGADSWIDHGAGGNPDTARADAAWTDRKERFLWQPPLEEIWTGKAAFVLP